MTIQKAITTHAIFFIVLGLLFTLYSPLVFAWLGFTSLFADSIEYWLTVSFARLFGAALCGWGMVILTYQRNLSSLQDYSPNQQRMLVTIILADGLLAFVSSIQAASVWGTSRGWLISAIFFLLALFSIITLVLSRKSH